MILLAHSYYLRHDPKKLARVKPNAPLSTLLAATRVRCWARRTSDDIQVYGHPRPPSPAVSS
jgi:hypothetical protein